MIFAIKHDGRHQARFVTRGHLTQPSIESVYSGAVSIHSIHLTLLIAKLNRKSIIKLMLGMPTWKQILKRRFILLLETN